MKYSMTLGVTIQAYTSFEFELDHVPTDEELVALAKQRAELFKFEPELGTESNLRIVDVLDEDDNCLSVDVEIPDDDWSPNPNS